MANLKVTRIVTRPDMSVNFFAYPEDVVAYITATYDDTGKRLSRESTMSEDKLVQTTVSVWADAAAFSECSVDPMLNGLREYNAEHKFIQSVVTEVV